MSAIRGFALLDSLLAFLALSLLLSPMLVLQAQTRNELKEIEQRALVLRLASSSAEQLRGLPSGEHPRVQAWLKRSLSNDCRACSDIVVSMHVAARRDQFEPFSSVLKIQWRDPDLHQLQFLVQQQ